MSTFLDVFAALLALGLAVAWVLTGGEKLSARLGSIRDRQHRQNCLMQDYAWSFICSNRSFTSDSRSLPSVMLLQRVEPARGDLVTRG
jgi:hypothetical protein